MRKPFKSVTNNREVHLKEEENLIHLIEELADSTLPTSLVKEHDDSCKIIDGMAVVNNIVNDNLMKTCQV